MSSFSKIPGFTVACVTLAALFTLGGGAAHARGYTLQILPPYFDRSGSYIVYPSGINDAGDIIGSTALGAATSYSVIYKNGVPHRIPAPAHDASVFHAQVNAQSINNAGQVLAQILDYDASNIVRNTSWVIFDPTLAYTTTLQTIMPVENTYFRDFSDTGEVIGFDAYPNGLTGHGLLWQGGNVSVLQGFANSSYAIPDAINNLGHIVGTINSVNGLRMVIWKGGVPTDVGAYQFQPVGINDNDQILGEETTVVDGQVSVYAHLWTQGVWTDVGKLGDADIMSPYDFNNKGWIVGQLYNSKSQTHRGGAYLKTGGPPVDLNSLLPTGSNYVIQSASRINNNDQIVGGGASDGGFLTSTFVLTPALAAKPTLTFVSPSLITAGATDAVVTVTGSGFENDTTVSINGGKPLMTQFVSSTKLLATVPHQLLSSIRQLKVTVYTPPAGGGTSNSISVSVATPVVSSVTPDRFDPGSVNDKITITGTSFVSGDVVTINDTYTVAATVLSSTQLTAALPSTVTGIAGQYYVRVVKPSLNLYSNPVHLNIAHAKAVISNVSPERIGAGLTSLSVYVYGTGFTAGTKVTFNGVFFTTPTSIQSNRLIVPVPAPILAQNGSYPIRVVNSFADGGTSEPKNFIVAPCPVLTAITPSTFKASAASVTLALTGANFEPGSVVKINDTTSVTPTFVSSTKLTIVLPSAVSSTGGSYFARVFNPGYSNNSAPVRFTVTPK